MTRRFITSGVWRRGRKLLRIYQLIFLLTAVVLVWIWAGEAIAKPKIVQALVQSGAEISVTGGTSGNVTLNGVGAGNLLTASCINDASNTATFSGSDNNSNTWVSAVSLGDANVGGLAQILYAKNVNSGNTTVTITATASITFRALVQEWSGSDTSAPLAAQDGNVDASTTSHQASASGINPGGPCICVVACCGIIALVSPAAGSGYTGEVSSSVFDFYEYQIFSSTPTAEKGKWFTSNSLRSVSVIAAFKAGAAGGATVPWILDDPPNVSAIKKTQYIPY